MAQKYSLGVRPSKTASNLYFILEKGKDGTTIVHGPLYGWTKAQAKEAVNQNNVEWNALQKKRRI